MNFCLLLFLYIFSIINLSNIYLLNFCHAFKYNLSKGKSKKTLLFFLLKKKL